MLFFLKKSALSYLLGVWNQVWHFLRADTAASWASGQWPTGPARHPLCRRPRITIDTPLTWASGLKAVRPG